MIDRDHTTAGDDLTIRRRTDGSIDAEFYVDRARWLRNICLSDALRTILGRAILGRRVLGKLADRVMRQR